MKKILLSLLALGFIAACSADDSKMNSDKKRRMRNIDRLPRNVRPSELMQVGIPKKSLFEISNGTQDDYDTSYESKEVRPNDYYQQEQDEYEGTYKIGSPYQVFGVAYVPQNYENFEEVGTASWYGDDFHGKPTANGETYNSGEMTAAHLTLPLPSMVRVTNLQNGRSAIVRVNDRGPFAKNRVIDVSEKAAEVLGFKDNGTTDVKVELLRNDTDEMLARLKIKN
jgi:rare lipoprotein A (peptidoglycan hydrolase)